MPQPGAAFGLTTQPRGALFATYWGTDNRFMLEPPATDFESRRGRCYELACAAQLFGSAPAGSLLVHGIIDGHTGFGPIGHAWLWLPDGGAWEPITGDVYPTREAFQQFADARVVRVYTYEQAQRLVAVHETFGPWHPHDYR